MANSVANPDRLGEAAAAWASSRWSRVGRWRIRYREAGAGPTVVLVHGLGLSADYWYGNGPPLASRGYRVLAPDLPGFGRTNGPPGGLSVLEQVAALREWMRSMDLPSAVLVGHSLSCQVTLELAAADPGCVDGLVLAAPTGDPREHRLRRQAWGILRNLPRESAGLLVEVAKAYAQAGPARVWQTWRKGALETPMPLLPCISAPTLIVLGERDPIVTREFARSLAQGLSDGRLALIPGAAHGLVLTHAEEFNAEIAAFMASRRPGTPADAVTTSPRPEPGSSSAREFGDHHR